MPHHRACDDNAPAFLSTEMFFEPGYANVPVNITLGPEFRGRFVQFEYLGAKVECTLAHDGNRRGSGLNAPGQGNSWAT